MDGFHTQQLKVNTLDDPKRWWEVIDRTTGEVVPTDKWFFDEPTGEVEIETVPYHEYTVSFLAFLIWDPVHMYNFLTNDWKDTPHQLTYDVRQPKTQAYVKEKLRRWCGVSFQSLVRKLYMCTGSQIKNARKQTVYS